MNERQLISFDYKVTRIGENSASTVTGIAPDTGCRFNSVEIRTQYTCFAAAFLKAPRSIVWNCKRVLINWYQLKFKRFYHGVSGRPVVFIKLFTAPAVSAL